MFEVEFKYYKQKEDLDYNKEEPFVFKNKFGKIDEDYPKEKLSKYNLESDVPAEPQAIPKIQQPAPQPQNKFVNLANKFGDLKTRKIMRKVAFVPPLRMDKSKFPYKFTLNKIYPVYSERYNNNGIGMFITTTDDNNDVLEVIDEYFVPANTSLEYENEMDAGKRGNNDLLNWQGDRSTGPMINLRGK